MTKSEEEIYRKKCCRGVTRGMQKGHNATGVKSLGAPKSPNNVISTFFNTAHLFLKDLKFEHGGAKLVSCPGRNLISVHIRDAVMPNVLFSPLQDTKIFFKTFSETVHVGYKV